MPLWMQRLMIRFFLKIIVGSYEQYGLQKPDHKIFEMHPTINTELLNYLKLGKIFPHPDIKSFYKTGVEFVDGTKVEVDIVVFATGYHIGVPMVQKGLLKYEDGIPQLVNSMMLPNYRNFYIVGISQARYGAGPLITMSGQMLAVTIKTQEKLQNPLANILLKLHMGQFAKRNNIKESLRNDVLGDPHTICKKIKGGIKFIPKMVSIEKWLITFGVKVGDYPY